MTQSIDNFLKYYINQKNTDYAILINGVWGCGKTYYIQNDFYDLLESLERRMVYVSLNGCNDNKSIFKKVFIQAISKREKSNKYYDFLENAIDIGKELPTDIGKAFSLVEIFKMRFEDQTLKQLNYDELVLVFDDLERISKSIEIDDIIGLLYESFTKNGAKTIFIGDETQIKNDRYKLIKEKTIRRTILFKPDFDSQFHSFLINHYKDSSIFSTLNAFETFMAECFKIYEIFNLRTVCFALDNFIQILEHSNSKLVRKYSKEMFKNIMVLTDKHKKGEITIEHITSKKGLNKLFYSLNIQNNSNIENNDKDKPYYELFYEEYLSKFGHDFVFINTIFEFILSGILDTAELENELFKLFEDTRPEEYIVLSELYSLRTIDFDKLNACFNRLIKFINEGRYRLIDLPSIYSLIVYIKEKGYLDISSLNIEELFRISFEKAKNNQALIPNSMDLRDGIDLYYKEVRTNEFCQRLVSLIHQTSLNTEEEITKAKIIELFNLAISGDNLFLSVCKESFFNNLFSKIYHTETYNMFTMLSNKGINLFEKHIHYNILNISNAGEYGYVEIEPLKFIKEYLISDIENRKEIVNFLKLRFYELIDYIDKAINHLDNTKRM